MAVADVEFVAPSVRARSAPPRSMVSTRSTHVPGLAAVAAGVHRERAADRAGDAGEELRAVEVVHAPRSARPSARRRRPRRTRCVASSQLGSRRCAACISTTVPRKPPSRTSRFEPRPTNSSGSLLREHRAGTPAGRRGRAGRRRAPRRPPARQLTCRAIGSSLPQAPAELRSRIGGFGHRPLPHSLPL